MTTFRLFASAVVSLVIVLALSITFPDNFGGMIGILLYVGLFLVIFFGTKPKGR